MKKLMLVPAIIAGSLLMTACSKKPETEELAAMRDSFTYSKYLLLSDRGLALGLKAYQKGVVLSGKEKMPEITHQDICLARSLLAYGALVTNKNTIALAETDLIDKNDCGVLMRGAAGSLRAVVYHREEWPQLAKEETQKSQSLLSSVSDEETAETQLVVFHLALGSNAVMGKDYKTAQVHADALALLLKAPWLGKAAQAGINFKTGNVTDAVRDVKRLSEDPGVPADIRGELAKAIQAIENKTGNVDAPAFMARVLLMGVWDIASEQSSSSWAKVSGFVKSQLDEMQTQESS